MTEKHVPKHRARRQPQRRRPLWTNEKTIDAVKKKTEAYAKYRETRDASDYIKYRRASSQVKSTVRKAVRDFKKRITADAKSNPKGFFKYAKSKLKTRAGVSDLERADGTMASCDASKAEVLNTFFTSVFTNEDTTNIPDFEHLLYNTQLTELTITQEGVRVYFKRLNKSKSPGPDGLHSCVLSELEEQLIEPFRQVFTKSMAEGEIPQDWKEGLVIPIFKKGKHHIPGNYRSVSLTSITCKMMERLVKNAIMEHLTTNNLLSETTRIYTWQIMHHTTPGNTR